MGEYSLAFKETALRDFAKIKKSSDIATMKKLQKILFELTEHPREGIGNPELLKYQLFGHWSRRINNKDMLIYEIIEEPEKFVVIISALGHYE
jgi:toxin YoeB